MSDTERGRLLLPGERLRSGREALGLSEADIAARMHLSVSYIRALEADDYERLPDAAFVRGYIKNYAKLVNLPADELANLFKQINQESRAEEPAPSPPEPVSRDRRLWWVGGVIGFAVAIWLFWPSSVESPQPLVTEPAFIDPLEPTVDDAASGIDEQGVEGEAFSAQTDELSGSESLAAEESLPESLADRLVVRFNELCWLRVRDASGEELYVGQRDAGETLELAGQGPFRLTLGNAAAVSAISFNDAGVRVPQAAPGQVITVRAP
ncbi:MAG: RodZ domain-containing protein [Alcanivoracaceae bacterium]|jgi:cytoskeleton protein RodZ|nr:RodZ domain-containing protein [Alcanivoracaceae bacterium]